MSSPARAAVSDPCHLVRLKFYASDGTPSSRMDRIDHVASALLVGYRADGRVSDARMLLRSATITDDAVTLRKPPRSGGYLRVACRPRRHRP